MKSLVFVVVLRTRDSYSETLWNQMKTPNQRHPNLASPRMKLSARKLAASLWHLRSFHLPSHPKIESSPPRVKRAEEEKRSYTRRRKLLKERKITGDSVVSVLLSELVRAQTCINKLKAERMDTLLWKHRQHHKSEAMLEDLKDQLARERKRRERMESLNAKLLNDLAEAKLYAKQFMVNYKEERGKRQLIEKVCNELATQIRQAKVKLEKLQRHSMRIREEMEEERNMFHMVELWREESIQMKLLDAKLALEDKYNQMIHLIAHLQSFLRSRGDELGSMDAQLIKQAAESVNVELSCDFTKTNDVFAIFEDLKIKERVIDFEPYYPPSSTVNIVSLDEDCCLNNDSVLHQSNKNGLGSEVECCGNADDGCNCNEHCDSVAQQNSEDSTFDCQERLTRSSVQSGGTGSTFMCKGSGESGFRQCELLGQRNFAESVNPHITRGMKGCIEWPRGIPKINSKVIPLEERVRKQKSQLQHILKPLA